MKTSVSKLEMISWLLIFVGGMAVPGVRAVSWGERSSCLVWISETNVASTLEYPDWTRGCPFLLLFVLYCFSQALNKSLFQLQQTFDVLSMKLDSVLNYFSWGALVTLWTWQVGLSGPDRWHWLQHKSNWVVLRERSCIHPVHTSSLYMELLLSFNLTVIKYRNDATVTIMITANVVGWSKTK